MYNKMDGFENYLVEIQDVKKLPRPYWCATRAIKEKEREKKVRGPPPKNQGVRKQQLSNNCF